LLLSSRKGVEKEVDETESDHKRVFVVVVTKDLRNWGGYLEDIRGGWESESLGVVIGLHGRKAFYLTQLNLVAEYISIQFNSTSAHLYSITC
jgi:hypothetical protein